MRDSTRQCGLNGEVSVRKTQGYGGAYSPELIPLWALLSSLFYFSVIRKVDKSPEGLQKTWPREQRLSLTSRVPPCSWTLQRCVGRGRYLSHFDGVRWLEKRWENKVHQVLGQDKVTSCKCGVPVWVSQNNCLRQETENVSHLNPGSLCVEWLEG